MVTVVHFIFIIQLKKMFKFIHFLTILFLPCAFTGNSPMVCLKEKLGNIIGECPETPREEYLICYFERLGLVNKNDQILVLRPHKVIETLEKHVQATQFFEAVKNGLHTCARGDPKDDLDKSVLERYFECFGRMRGAMMRALCPLTAPKPKPPPRPRAAPKKQIS